MFECILFLATTLILSVALMMVPKNKAKLNGVTWIIATVTSIIALFTLLGGIINLFGVPVNLMSLSVINALTALAAFIFIWRKKKCQGYFVKWQDVVMIAALAVITIVVGYIRFGERFDVFAYESDDSVRHYMNALELAKTGNITTSRYVLYLINMIFIKCADPFVGEMYRYSAFLAADLFVLFLMGATFWMLIRKYISGRFAMVAGMIMTFLYWFGYPFNSFLHGFEYLGAGIIMITYLLWVLQNMEFDRLPAWMNVVLVMIANMGVFVSYTQFAPAVLVGEVIYLFLFYKKRKRIFSWNALAVVLAGIGIPGFICVCYVVPQYMDELWPIIILAVVAIAVLAGLVWLGLFVQSRKFKKTIAETIKIDREFLIKNKALCIILIAIVVVILLFAAYKYVYLGMIVRFAADKGMASDGNIYREPYANFLVLLFPVCMYLCDCIRKKKNDATIWMFFGTFIFSIWLIRCIITGSIGSYYFYKMHYIFWLFLFVCAFKYIAAQAGEAKWQMQVYIGVWTALFVVFASGIERKMVAAHDWMWTDNVGTTVFGIYDYNLELFKNGGNVNEDMQIIYNVIHGIKMEDENALVPFFGTEYRYIKDYYYYMTGQNPADHLQALNKPGEPAEDIIAELKALGVERIFVESVYEGAYVEEFSELRTEFETEYGSILIIE